MSNINYFLDGVIGTFRNRKDVFDEESPPPNNEREFIIENDEGIIMKSLRKIANFFYEPEKNNNEYKNV